MGEAVFKSKFRNFFEQIDVPSATKTFQRTYFAAKVILEVNFLRKKNLPKIGVRSKFWSVFIRKLRFFGTSSSLKFIAYWPHRRLKTIFLCCNEK